MELIQMEDLTGIKFTCRQRMESGRPPKGKSSPDSELQKTNVDTWQELENGDFICSFCGSLHSDQFQELVQDRKQEGSTIRLTVPQNAPWEVLIHRPGVTRENGGVVFYGWHEPGNRWEDR